MLSHSDDLRRMLVAALMLGTIGCAGRLDEEPYAGGSAGYDEGSDAAELGGASGAGSARRDEPGQAGDSGHNAGDLPRAGAGGYAEPIEAGGVGGLSAGGSAADDVPSDAGNAGGGSGAGATGLDEPVEVGGAGGAQDARVDCAGELGVGYADCAPGSPLVACCYCMGLDEQQCRNTGGCVTVYGYARDATESEYAGCRTNPPGRLYQTAVSCGHEPGTGRCLAFANTGFPDGWTNGPCESGGYFDYQCPAQG